MRAKDLIRKKYAEGHEMALHTYTHLALGTGSSPHSQEIISRELQRNLQYLVDIGVRPEDITGFRAPFLDTASWGPGPTQDVKNNALLMMQVAFNELGIYYDSTFVAQPDASAPRVGVRHCSDAQGGWGYRACSYDQRAEYDWPGWEGGYPSFSAASDPSKSWHTFMNAYTWNGKQLQSMDQVDYVCRTEGPCTVDQVKAIYYENFNKHYYGERSPFGIFMHGYSLMKGVEVEGLVEFLNEVRQMPGVQMATQGEVAAAYRRQQQQQQASKQEQRHT